MPSPEIQMQNGTGR